MRIPKTWAITDTHWFHQYLIVSHLRPADYEQKIKHHWRRLVMPEDTVIHLGDVILAQHSLLKEILAELPGKKILVRGNHDHESDGWYERAGFSFVAQGLLVGGVYLTHAPQVTLPDGAVVNVHGHLHDDDHRGANFPQHCMLLAIERTDYAPVELQEFVGFSLIRRKILMPYDQNAAIPLDAL